MFLVGSLIEKWKEIKEFDRSQLEISNGSEIKIDEMNTPTEDEFNFHKKHCMNTENIVNIWLLLFGYSKKGKYKTHFK